MNTFETNEKIASEKLESLSKNIQDVRKNQMEILELKNTFENSIDVLKEQNRENRWEESVNLNKQ